MESSCSYDTTLGAISADRGRPLGRRTGGDPLDGGPGATPWFRRTGASPWLLVHRSQCLSPLSPLSPLSLQSPAELVCARWSLAVCVGSGDQKFRWRLACREGRLTGCRRGAQAAAVLTARAGRRPGVRLGHVEHAGEVIAAFLTGRGWLGRAGAVAPGRRSPPTR
jgi:hypothetical protein